MDAIKEHNERYQFFQDITGEAMRVHRKYERDSFGRIAQVRLV